MIFLFNIMNLCTECYFTMSIISCSCPLSSKLRRFFNFDLHIIVTLQKSRLDHDLYLTETDSFFSKKKIFAHGKKEQKRKKGIENFREQNFYNRPSFFSFSFVLLLRLPLLTRCWTQCIILLLPLLQLTITFAFWIAF